MNRPAPADQPSDLSRGPSANAVTPAALARPAGKAGSLVGRLCVHASAMYAHEVIGYLDPLCSGLVVAGTRKRPAVDGVRNAHDAGYTGVVVADPAAYVFTAATPEKPFEIDDGRLWVDPLQDFLDEQMAAGASVALTPTGFIRSGEPGTLRAVVAAAEHIRDRGDTVLAVPLDVAWLNRIYIDQTIGILSTAGMPVGLMLGGQMNPVDKAKAIIPNLRRLYQAVPHVALFRTDLIGFDALGQGGLAAAIGAGGSFRHTVDPDEIPHSYNPEDPSPSVLFPDLATWKRGSTLAKIFGGGSVPHCHCRACGDRALNSFHDKKDSRAARDHGIAVWMEWAQLMLSHADPGRRATWWRTFCVGRVAEHEAWCVRLRQPDVFKPQPWLRRCAN